MTSSDFRKEARQKLSGKWGKVALIIFLYYVIFFALGFVCGLLQLSNTPIETIVTLIIEIPLAFGLIISCVKIYNNEDVQAFDFFTLGFQNFSKSWGITLQTALKMILPIIAIVVSVVLIGIGTAGAITSSSLSSSDLAISGFSGIGILGVILYFVATIWAVVKGYLYQLAYIISADETNLSSKEAVQKSEEIMKGNRGKLFVLQLSFIGWSILAAFTFGIGLLWLIPYMQFATIAFYYFLANKNNNNSEKFYENQNENLMENSNENENLNEDVIQEN